MTTLIQEGLYSREASFGQNTEAELIFYAFNDEGDEVAASRDVFFNAPLTYRGMPRRGCGRQKYLTTFTTLDAVTYSVFEVPVQYGMEFNQAQPSDPTGQTPGMAEFNTTITFNLIGGTTHISQALETKSYALLRAATDVRRTIGLDLKTGQVRGLDIFAPVMDYSLTAQFPNHVVTDAFIDTLFDMTPSTNNASFKRRDAGEVLFKGARGTKKGDELWEITFEFARSKNQTGLNIGGIAIPTKRGWEYLDVMYIESTSSLDRIGGKPILIPDQVNVHRVFPEDDFSKLKIGVV